jgi:hypothetical protein
VVPRRYSMKVKTWMFVAILVMALLAGCGGRPRRMEHAENPEGLYREQIAVARRVLEVKENWADRAEWEVRKSPDGWTLIAWRVEHPERKGPERYVPWGYAVIELDRRLMAINYRRRG